MYINEDFLTKWVYNNNGLCITRSINNLNKFNFNYKNNFYVIITGYQKIIDLFFNSILKKINSQIIIILIESDIINIKNEYLNNNKIIHFFTWNKNQNHHKISCIPIGLNFKRQYKSILTWISKNNIKNIENNTNKKLLCFNCNLNTSPKRKVLKNIIEKNMNKFCDKLPYTPFLETKIIDSFIEGKIKIDITNPKCYDYWNKYKFILSPEGTGLDCHRTWEAIILDIIPIVKSSSIDKIFEDLPILIIKNWNELSIDFLNKKYIEIMENKKNGKYNLDKINLSYWTDIIEQKLYKIPDIMKK